MDRFIAFVMFQQTINHLKISIKIIQKYRYLTSIKQIFTLQVRKQRIEPYELSEQGYHVVGNLLCQDTDVISGPKIAWIRVWNSFIHLDPPLTAFNSPKDYDATKEPNELNNEWCQVPIDQTQKLFGELNALLKL